MSNPQQLVNKQRSYYNILPPSHFSYGETGRDDGLSLPPSLGYGGTGKPSVVPKEFTWPSLLACTGRFPFVNAFIGELA